VIDPTSAWLVFREGSQQTFSRGLFTVPLDGSAAPVLLNAPLGPGGALLSFTEFSRPRFTPDGSRVVYLLDVGSFRGDVYSAPIDGSKASIRLSAPPDNHTITFRITLDGGRVIYLADQEAAHAYELYSVPIRGDTPPIKVNAPLVPGGSVTTFKLSPDGKCLAYVADPELADHYDVYLAMLDPGHEVIRVSDPAVSPYVYPVTFSALEFVPDGSLLVYTGYDAGLQLYAVPLQGDRRPWRLDGPPVEGGSVQSSDAFPINSADDYNVRIGAHGKLAVYLADEDEDGVYELFASPLSRPRLGRR